MTAQSTINDLPAAGTPRFATLPAHRLWLIDNARALFDFFQLPSFNPAGGFFALDENARPIPPKPGHKGANRQVHETSRMVHSFAIAHLLGIPGADRIVDHGLAFLWERMRDAEHGGYFWGVDDEKPTNPTKQAYGHAFVLLAASSAMCVGHPDAPRLLADVTQIIEERFWDKAAGATTEEYNQDWSPMGTYRGQNSNMHLTEALMAAFEATGDRGYLDKAESIASLIIDRHARAEGWRVAEHFTENWGVDRGYKGDPMFRPSGTTPGHALEWSRLLVQLWELGGRGKDWMIEAATGLFRKTVSIGWDRKLGGFYYTLDWSDRPDQKDRFWWPCAEGVGAAAALGSVNPDDPSYEEWYRRVWSFVATHVIDKKHGWHPELDSALNPVSRVFEGRPDIYHAVQACLIPLFPADGSLTRQLKRSGLKL
jgi:sulfoquinovose isomerase